MGRAMTPELHIGVDVQPDALVAARGWKLHSGDTTFDGYSLYPHTGSQTDIARAFGELQGSYPNASLLLSPSVFTYSSGIVFVPNHYLDTWDRFVGYVNAHIASDTVYSLFSSQYLLTTLQDTPTGRHISWRLYPNTLLEQYGLFGQRDVAVVHRFHNFSSRGQTDGQNVACAVSLGRGHSVISFVDGGIVLFEIDVPFGTRDLVLAIRGVLGCDAVLAQRILETHGVLHSHYDTLVRDALIGALSPFLAAVSYSVSHWNERPYRSWYEYTRPLVSMVPLGLFGYVPGLDRMVAHRSGLGVSDFVDTGVRTHLVAHGESIPKKVTQRHLGALSLLLSV